SLRTGRATDTAVLAGIGALGLLDDLLEPHMRRAGRPVSKGLRGHLGALRRGRLTTGALTAAGIPLLALAGAAASPAPRGGAMVLADAALTAGCANLANLLDLRPGRALKVILPAAALLAAPAAAGSARAATRTHLGRAAPPPALAAPALTAGWATLADPRDLRPGRALKVSLPAGALLAAPAGAGRARVATRTHLGRAALLPALVALPPDLREHGMRGDAGANVLGAAVGTAAARSTAPPARLGMLALVVALNLASETVSFSTVIERTPVLR